MRKKLSLDQLLELIELEDARGIVDKAKILETVITKGMPKLISDIRGALRLAVERDGSDFSVTIHQTELANNTIGEIY